MADLKTDLAECVRLHGKATLGRYVVVTGKNISVGPCPGKRVALCNYDNGPIERANAAAIAALHNLFHDHDHGDELLAVVRDAERYRWLRENRAPNNRWPHVVQTHEQSFDTVSVPQLRRKPAPSKCEEYRPEYLDEAIDAAIAGRAGDGG